MQGRNSKTQNAGTVLAANGAIFLCCLIALGSAPARAVAQQSSSTPASPPASTPAPDASSKSQQPPANDENSFPEAVSRKAAKDTAAKKKTDEQSPDAGQEPAAPAGNNDPGNAFPEETSEKAASRAKAAESGSSSDAGADTGGGTGTSSSGDYDRRMAGSGRATVPVNVPMPHVNGKDPVKEDLSVGTFYLQTGDFRGAYQRLHEASLLAPENTDVMFGLAEAARHLKKREEAMSNYQLYLQVVPNGSKAKDARKAIASLDKDK